jgi:hypothetical protein
MSQQINQSASKMSARGVVIPASQSDAVISVPSFGIAMNSRDLLRVDVLVGRSVAATGVTVSLQDSSGAGIWRNVKDSSAISASTNRTLTPDSATDIFTSVGHGFTSGQAVALYTTGTLPVGLDSSKIYYVKVLDADSFQLTAVQNDGIITDITSDGTGTLTASAVRVVSLTINNAVSGDQALIPIKSQCRVVADTGAGDSLQVMDVRVEAGT